MVDKKNVKDILKVDKSRLFGKITKDKDVTMFTRLIVPYNTTLGKSDLILFSKPSIQSAF